MSSIQWQNAISPGGTEGGMLLKRGNWVGNTTRPPLWTIHKSFGQRLQISKTEYIPVISTISGLQSHTLFTNRGETRIQAIKLTPRFADTSNSWEAGELRSHFSSLQQESQMRAPWTPHTFRHGRWARARTACRCDATSDWLGFYNDGVKRALIGQL